MHVTLAEELDLRNRDVLARVTGIALLFGLTYVPVFVTLYGKSRRTRSSPLQSWRPRSANA